MLSKGDDSMKTEFHFLLFKSFHAQRNHIRKDMCTYGLSPGQPKVLRYVYAHNNCMLKDIATSCDVEPATVSKILNTMEEKGMIKRMVVKGNKRAMSVSISEQGKQAFLKWVKHCDEVQDISLHGFSSDEIAKFEEFLCRMYFNLTGKEIE